MHYLVSTSFIIKVKTRKTSNMKIKDMISKLQIMIIVTTSRLILATHHIHTKNQYDSV